MNLEPLFSEQDAPPLHLEQKGGILISDNPIVLDLFFLDQFNGLIIKGLDSLNGKFPNPCRDLLEINTHKDIDKLDEYNFKDEFKQIILELLEGLSSTRLGIEITPPQKEMCPKVHVDRLPLRLVQCLDGPGTTLILEDGSTYKTNKNDLILMKGDKWKSNLGGLKHRSPRSPDLRTLLRVDFLN